MSQIERATQIGEDVRTAVKALRRARTEMLLLLAETGDGSLDAAEIQLLSERHAMLGRMLGILTPT